MRCAPLIPEVGGCWWGGNFVPSRRNGTAAAARDGNARRAEPNKPNRLHNGGGWMLLMMTSRSYIHGRSIFSLLNSTTPRPTNCRFDALLLLLLDLCSSTLSFFFFPSSIPFILSGSFEAATNDSRWTHPSRALSSPLLVVVVKAKSATQSLFFSGRRRRKTAGTLTLLYRVYNDDYLKKNKEKEV